MRILDQIKDSFKKGGEKFTEVLTKKIETNSKIVSDVKGLIVPPKAKYHSAEDIKAGSLEFKKANRALSESLVDEKIRNQKFKSEYQVKNSKGEIIANPSLEDIKEIHSDDSIVNFVATLKNQRHITKENSRGVKLDQVHDGIVETLVETRATFSEPESQAQLQQTVLESLKISESRGTVVHTQSKMFQDYESVNREKLNDLKVNAVTLSNRVAIDKINSPEAEVICHSSLSELSPDSFNGAVEIAAAKVIATKLNTKVFVTGDVSVSDPELIKFIGNRKLIVLESKQTNFDYYIHAMTSEGELVVIRGDLKNRPYERASNSGEINNADDNTFILVGNSESTDIKSKTISGYCDVSKSQLYTEIQNLEDQPGSFHDPEIQSQIKELQRKIDAYDVYKKTQEIADLQVSSKAKLVFYENFNVREAKDSFETDTVTYTEVD